MTDRKPSGATALNLDDVEEFTRIVGLNLNSEQTADLQELLYRYSASGRWRWPTWTMHHPSPDLLAARALIGLFVLDEDIIWSVPQQAELTRTFHRLVANVGQSGSQTVKVRHANGEQSIERLDTGTRLRLMHSGLRGYSGDLLIVEGSERLTREQRDDLLPTMAARPNPQLIYA